MQGTCSGFVGTFFHSVDGRTVEKLEKSLIVVSEEGIITDIVPATNERFDILLNQLKAKSETSVKQYPDNFFFLPGFVDLHVHAPQFPNLGTGLYLPLEQWLNKITFPLEASYQDVTQAKKVYPSLVSTLLSHGTTCVLYFSTIHVESTLELAKACLEKGQRAFIGKVCMDNESQCPEYYRENTENSLKNTKIVIDAIHQLADEYYAKTVRIQEPTRNVSDRRLVRPVITPRFIPSCTDELLQGLGELAEQYGNVLVQSHCSESNWAVEYCANRFQGKSDTEVYKQFGLLRENSVWAHSIYLSDSDLELFRHSKASVAHCPLSNFYFANAGFPYKRAANAGVNVGLGTDISGGYSASLYDNCRLAVLTSQALENGINPSDPERGVKESKVTIEETFIMATIGGAKALGIDHLIGSFTVGKYFDAQVVSMPDFVLCNPVMETDSSVELEKLMHHTTQQHIKGVWVSGKQCYFS